MTLAPSEESPRFVSVEEAETLHETAVLQYGGSLGLRNRALLESAMAQARQAVGGSFLHEWPFGMAAAYVYHVARNHPFLDGNKRAAFAVCVAFLRMNGWNLEADEASAEKMVLEIVAGACTKDEAAEWLATNAKRRPSMELRDFFTHLNYAELAETFGSIAASPIAEIQATNRESFEAIPAVAAAWAGSAEASAAGDTKLARILEQHAMLLTAIFRIAEDMGYEW